MRERTRLDQAITGYHDLKNALDDAVALAELAERMGLVSRRTVAVFGRTILEPLDGRR